MFYIQDTKKTFEQASTDLENESKNLGFGVLHIHNLGETLRSKGIDFKEECKIFEICNPNQANRVLSIDMKLNTALPCRISVYTEDGTTKIGLIKPNDMFETLTDNKKALEIAKEVENTTIQIIDNTK